MQAAKMFCILIISAAVMAVCAIAPVRTCFADAETYTFFCGTSSADCREIRTAENFSLTKALLNDVCGECAVYSAENFVLEDFLANYNAEVIFIETLTDSVNYYCTADLPYSTRLYGRQISLHVCVKDGAVLAASPIIFGGY